MAEVSRVLRFLQEAKRRRIYTSAVAYVAITLVLIQLGEAVFNALVPEQAEVANRILTILLILGAPVVLVLAWIFDIGPGGISRTGELPSRAASGDAVKELRPGGGAWAGGFTPKAELPAPQIELTEEAPDPERVRRASLSFVRHELRTPINAIIGYSEMLLDDARDEGDEVSAADLERIQRCGRAILTLVDGILDAERISAESGRDLASYSEQIRADLRDPLSAVTGYTEMLIELSEESERTGRVADLQKILSASRKLLDLSNDIVAVATSAPDAVHADMKKGATLAEGVLSKIRAVQGAHVDVERHGSLLVVDDSVMNRELLAKQLARKGYVVTTAENGHDALQRMEEQEFDLVLLDVLMPEMDGVEVLRRMKNDSHLRDVPVIMISALDEVDSVVRCLEIGAADFVSKPFHPTLLDARINATLTAQRAHQHATHTGGSRTISAGLPDYAAQRLANGEQRLLDGAASAAVYFVDVEQAVPASGNAVQRAGALEALIESAYAAARENGVLTVVAQSGGIVMIAGFPQPVDNAADRIAAAALSLARDTESSGVRFRSALNVGAVYAAVVGNTSLSFWLWGDGVDLARKLATSSERGQIAVSPACHALLKDRFAIASRGVVEIAGRGQVRGYVLESRVPAGG